MKLSNEEFIRHLAVAMQTDEQAAEKHLSEWVLHIRSELEQHGSFTIEGLGTLTRSEDTILFVPDADLAMEINYKYAGMKPLQLAPGRPGEVSQEAILPESEDKELSAQGSETAETEKQGASETEKEGASGADLVKQDTPGADLESQRPAVTKEKREETVGTEPEKEMPAVVARGHKEDVEALYTDTVSEESSKHTAFTAKPAESTKKRRTSLLLRLIPVAAVLIVAFLLYVHFDGQRLDQNNFGSVAEQELTISDVPLPAPGEHTNQTSVGPSAGSDNAATADHTHTDTHPTSQEAPDEVSAEVYGLHGTVHSAVSGAYSIVVYSLSNAERARAERNRIEEQGFRALLWMATTSDGSTTWRVGAGQFRSVADAVEAADRLPEPYKSNHFIIRIQ